MAITSAELQILWSTASLLSISAASNGTSDAMTLDGANIGDLTYVLKAANDGTPASGDTVDFYALFTNGDPDGASTDEYTTVPGFFLGTCDTNDADPTIVAAISPGNWKGLKIHTINNSAGRAITVSVAVYEKSG